MKELMKLAKLSSAVCVALMTFIAPLPKKAYAQTCYAEPYSKNRDFIQVSIDTHGLETNALLSDVSVEVSYRAGSNEARKGWPFTDNNIPSLRADQVYRRYFALNEGPDIEILGGHMSYVKGVGG